MNLDEQRKQAGKWLALREKARTNLLFLANDVLAPPDSRIIVPHAHGCILNHCQQFTGIQEAVDPDRFHKNGMPVMRVSITRHQMWELPGTRNNLLLVSRGHLKTTIHTVAHIIQWILNYPNVRILMCTATDEKAQIIVGKIKQHFQFNPRFRYLFPEFCPDARKASDWGSKTEFSVPNRTRNDEPTVMTAAVGKALASTHHDVIKCSDVVTENNVRTDGQIAEVKEWFGYLEPLRERFPSRDGEPSPGWKDVEGTIYHFADFYQTIIENEEKLSEKTWKVTKQSCWVDERKTVPLWPERFPAKELHRIENSPEVGPVLFASQYELNPITGVDGLCKAEQIKWFPAKMIAELMPRYRVHTTVDLSNMDPTTDGDATVFSTCGFDRDGRCDVLSIIKGRFTLDEVVEWFFRISQVYPTHQSFKVQKDHFSRTLWPILQREQAKRGRWLNIVLTPVSTRISKQQRIRGLQAWFMQGLIRFADNISCRKDLINEILRFPKGAHDDILDTLADQMHNRDGQPTIDVYPDADKFSPFGVQRPENVFTGFDPISKEAKWLYDTIQSAHNEFNPVTGAL